MLIEVLGEFHETSLWCCSPSASFISLIPKKEGVRKIKDYRLKNLVGSFYKLLAKVLSCRLEEVM